jgi:hypothetical protein
VSRSFRTTQDRGSAVLLGAARRLPSGSRRADRVSRFGADARRHLKHAGDAIQESRCAAPRQPAGATGTSCQRSVGAPNPIEALVLGVPGLRPAARVRGHHGVAVTYQPRRWAEGLMPHRGSVVSRGHTGAAVTGQPSDRPTGLISHRHQGAGLVRARPPGQPPGQLSTPTPAPPYAHHMQNENTFYFVDGKASA